MKKLFIKLFLFCLCFCTVWFVGCSEEQAPRIQGVKNIEISVKEIDYDFMSGVNIIGGKENDKITVDSSAVRYGTVGEYKVIYSVGDYSISAKVKIYDIPTVFAENTELTFSEAISGSDKGIIAIDSFGEKLSVVYIGSNVNADFAYKYNGVYVANYYVEDKVGNVLNFSRKITVRKEKDINFGSLVVDLADDSEYIELTDGSVIAAIDENGEIYSLNQIGDKVKGFSVVGSVLGVGRHQITVYTDQGYGPLVIDVKDEEDLKYKFNYGNESSGIDNYIFSQGETIVFPQIVNGAGSYQNFDVSYKLYRNSEEINFDDFDSLIAGEYDYVAVISRNGVVSEVKNRFYIVSEEEKLNHEFSVNSNQFLYNYNASYVQGADLKYVEKVTDANGVSYNAINFSHISSSGDSSRTLSLNQEILAKLFAQGSMNLSFKIMLAQHYDYIVYTFMFAYSGSWTCSNNFQYPVKENEWTTVSFNLSDCWVRSGVPDIFTVDYYGNVTINYSVLGIMLDKPASAYIADVQFGAPSLQESMSFYDLSNGDFATLYNGTMTVKTGNVNEVYENLYVYQNGVIKIPNNISDKVLGWDKLAQISGNVLNYNEKEYINFKFDGGKIYNDGMVELSRYGEILEDYGFDTKYKLIRLINNSPVEWNNGDFTATLNEEGGYDFVLDIYNGENKTAEFHNCFYVANDDSALIPNNLSSDYLKYAGLFDIDGIKQDCFKIEVAGNPNGHKFLQISAEYVNKMLDLGYDSVVYSLMTETNTGDQQIYRLVDGAVTFSGAGNTLVPGTDYMNVAPSQYGTWVTYSFKIDESCRNKSIGISVMRNVIIKYVKFMGNDKEIKDNSVLPQVVNDYLACATDSAKAEYLYNYQKDYIQADSSRYVKLTWETLEGSNFRLLLATDENFNDVVYDKQLVDKTINIYNLVPNKYYWKVMSDSADESGSFEIDDEIRFINGVNNMRDMGGRTGELGKIKYELSYRASDITIATSKTAIDVLVDQLGIKSEIDLRRESNNALSSPDPSITYYNYGIYGYYNAFPFLVGNRFDKSETEHLKSIFKLYTDINNYPIVFHCAAGADRTGTVGLLLGGLLGMTYEQLMVDYELTSFYISARWRSNILFDGETYSFVDEGGSDTGVGAMKRIYNHIMDEYGTGDVKFYSAVENYLITEVGLTKADIETIRTIMIENYEAQS